MDETRREARGMDRCKHRVTIPTAKLAHTRTAHALTIAARHNQRPATRTPSAIAQPTTFPPEMLPKFFPAAAVLPRLGLCSYDLHQLRTARNEVGERGRTAARKKSERSAHLVLLHAWRSEQGGRRHSQIL